MLRILCLTLLAAFCLAHPHAPKIMNFVPEALGSDPIITGEGKFRYQYMPTKLALPTGVQLQNAHGLAMSHVDGSIYFTYESVAPSKTQPATRALIRYNADGTGGTLLGSDNKLALGVPHGLKLSVEDGVEYLYHANNAAIVSKTDMNGKIIWYKDMTKEWTGTDNWPFKPTDVLVPPGSPIAFVADGYGSSKVHGFDIKTGNYTGFVFGGRGSGDSPIQFNCDHGISYDTRVDQILVSDRANHRLRWIHRNGTLVAGGTKVYPECTLPCNAQTSNGTVLGGDYLIVPGLGEDVSGSTFVLDKSNNIISTLEINMTLGSTGSKHPHDAIFLQNGDIAVACWAPGTLTYWKHLASEE